MLNGETTISVVLLISIFSLVLSTFATLSNAKKNQKDSVQKEKDEMDKENERRLQMREEFVKVNLKLDAFCRSLEELLKKQDKTVTEMNEIKSTILRYGMQIDDHEKRITTLEKR